MALENSNSIKMENPDFVPLDSGDESPEKKKKSKTKFLVYFLIIIVLTGLALFLSLYKDFNGVVNALQHADWKWLLVIVGLVALSYCVDAFTIFAFSRLYTRKYKFHQGLATSMIGGFYSGVTPGASGGQIMEAYTMKKQGVEASSAASIMVMAFIVYQICLIILGAIGLFFNASLLTQIGTFNITIGDNVLHIPAIPFTIAGFLLNLFVILLLFLMSYSRKMHNFILHYGIGLLGKMHILKKPDETRESLRIQVENFKIELRRLCSNVPIFILMLLCFSIMLMIRFSIPFFAGLALNGYGYCLNSDGSLVLALNSTTGSYQAVQSIGQADVASFFKAIFLSSYHQMTAGLIPIPGAAGVSEYFFNTIFANFYTSQQVTTAAQILWRVSTYHLVLLVGGIVAATYRSSPKNEIHHANRKTFVTLQYQTYDERKKTSDTMFETSSLSRKEIQKRLKELKIKKPKDKVKNENVNETSVKKKEDKHKKNKKNDKNIKSSSLDWDEIEVGDDE